MQCSDLLKVPICNGDEAREIQALLVVVDRVHLAAELFSEGQVYLHVIQAPVEHCRLRPEHGEADLE